MALIMAACTFPAGLLVEWKSVKKEKQEHNNKGHDEDFEASPVSEGVKAQFKKI